MKHAARINKVRDDHPDIGTSEAQTKASLIQPLLRCLGYDVADPEQVRLEVPTEIGGKIDYELTGHAGMKIAVEAKKADAKLSAKETNQLRSYFHFSPAAAGILTNGIDYWLFTDSRKTNVLDPEPYRKVDVRNLSNNDIQHLESLARENVDEGVIRKQARMERIRTQVDRIIEQELRSPSQEFLRLVGKKVGVKPLTKPNVELLRPLVTEAIRRTFPTPSQPPHPSPPSPPTSDSGPWPSVYPHYDPGNPKRIPSLKEVTLLGRPLLVNNYTHMLCLVVAVLHDKHPASFADRVSREPFFKESRTYQYISSRLSDFNPKYLKDTRQIGGYYIDVGLSAKEKVRRARLFLEAFEHDPEKLVIHTTDD